jgi:hypothetical protein
MTLGEVTSAAWWTQEPYASLVRRLGQEPATFGVLAYDSPSWKTTSQRTQVWDALDQLTATGLARRERKGWVASGQLAEVAGALGEAQLDYFDRLYNKAVEVGDIAEGDQYFCGDCCYSYDDIPEPDDDLIWSQALAPLTLAPASGKAPDINLRTSTARAVAGEGLLAIVVAPMIVVGVASAAVWFAGVWLVSGSATLARRGWARITR